MDPKYLEQGGAGFWHAFSLRAESGGRIRWSFAPFTPPERHTGYYLRTLPGSGASRALRIELRAPCLGGICKGDRKNVDAQSLNPGAFQHWVSPIK